MNTLNKTSNISPDEPPEAGRFTSAPGAMRNREGVSHKAERSVAVNTSKSLIGQLRRDFPKFIFKKGKRDHWSPKTNTIIYKSGAGSRELQYGILHELAHAQLGHSNYRSDFELLKLESAAWELAAKIGRKYKIRIDSEHIQNCLDTYRDWLHARSTCPTCGTNVLQKDPHHYYCFNCQSQWSVTSGHFVRPYRLLTNN